MGRSQKPGKQGPEWKDILQLAIQTAAMLASIAKIVIDFLSKR